MGQGESAHKVDYLLEKDKLIKQYRGVDISSVSAPSSRVSTPHIVPKHSLHRNHKLWDKEDYRTFLHTGNDSKTVNNNSSPSRKTNGQLNRSDKFGSLRGRGEKDFVEDSTEVKQDAGKRKSGEPTDPRVENRSSSEKIFEEHAEYANELLNAPYIFTTSFASIENIALKRYSSTGDVSVADSKVGQTPAYKYTDKDHDRLVNQLLSSSDASKSVLRDPIRDTDSKPLVGNKREDILQDPRKTAQEKGQPETEFSSKDISPGVGIGIKAESPVSEKTETRPQRLSRVEALREKFEAQGRTPSQKSARKSAAATSKSVGTPGALSTHFNRRLSLDSVDRKRRSHGERLHEVLSRKRAVLVDVGSDLNTETTESVKQSSDSHQPGLTQSHDPVQTSSQSSVFILEDRHQSVNQAVAEPSKIEVTCGILPPHKQATNAGELPSVSKVVTINGRIKPDIDHRHVHLVKPHSSGGESASANCVINSSNREERDVHTEDFSPSHRPARVHSLRRRFEGILTDRANKEAPSGYTDTRQQPESSSHPGTDTVFQLHKFPVLRSRSDSHIKLEDKESGVHRKQSHSSKSKEDADVIYHDTLVRNTQQRRSLNTHVRRINIPERPGDKAEGASHLQKTSHVRKRDVILSHDKTAPVEEHLYEEYTVKVPSVKVKDSNPSIKVKGSNPSIKVKDSNNGEVLLPIRKKNHKRHQKQTGGKHQQKQVDTVTSPVNTQTQKQSTASKHVSPGPKKQDHHRSISPPPASQAKSPPLVPERQHQHRATNPPASQPNKPRAKSPPLIPDKPHPHLQPLPHILPVVKTRSNRRHSEEILSGDCIVTELQKGSAGHSDRKPVVSRLPPQTHLTQTRDMDFRKMKKDSKRHRRKSDSSTSNLSDSSTQQVKSSKKWRKASKQSKDRSRKQVYADEENDAPGLSHNWGSMIHEYQEKYVTDERGRRVPMETRGAGRPDQYTNVRQVFNRGMVLPVKRAPPGLSAQEVESESGATDYSTHSWTAMHRPAGMRAHMDAAAFNGGGQTYVKERIDDSFSSSVGGGMNGHMDHTTRNGNGMNGASHMDHSSRRGNRMRISSQSSQYTSDAPLSPGRQRRVLAGDMSHQQYGEAPLHRSLTPDPHARLTRYHSDLPSSPDVPRRMRLTRQYVSYNSDGGAMSPALVRRVSRHSSVPRDHHNPHARESSVSRERLEYGGSMPRDHSHARDRSMSRERLEYGGSLQRPVRLQQHQYSKARSLSRDRLEDHTARHRRLNTRSMSTDALTAYPTHPPPPDNRTRDTSLSREYLHQDHAPLSPTSHRKKLVQFDKKYKKKKSIDEKAKGFVDDVIDEAMDMFSLSSKSKKRSKSKEKMISKKNQSQKNIVHTTNVYNEFVEEDSPDYGDERYLEGRYLDGRYLDRKAVSDAEDYRSYNQETQAIEDFEQDLRSLREIQQRKPSVLRPQPINGSLSAERRSCIRPVAGSGITRDGSAPPPKSAYKNYDFELSVGPNQYTAESKSNRRNAHQYVSDSEFSTMDLRSRKKSSYPNIKFGPARAKSEDNLLSDMPKPVMMTNVTHQQQARPAKRMQAAESVNYDSDIEDKGKINPPTLTRGMVTKILHKLEDDVNKLSSRKAKPKQRPKVEVDMFNSETDQPTNTWPKKDSLHPPQSQVGATLYGTLPADKPTEQKPYSTYLPLLNDSTGPLLTSSPVNGAHHTPNTPKIEILPSQHQAGHQDLSGSLAHTRFKMYHGDPVKVHQVDEHSKSMQMTSEHNMANIAKKPEKQDNSYGVFSNENMIVADLANSQGSRRASQTDKYQVRKIGQLYGTQPDVSMNKQQTLNFYLFNQVKGQNEEIDKMTPQVNYMARNVEYTNMGQKEKQADIFVNESALPQTETELHEYLIHHKQTQTPAPPPTRNKDSSKHRRAKKHVDVQQAYSLPQQSAKKHTETTHYVTKEREIEKLPAQKQYSESGIQTEQQQKRAVQQYVQTDGEEEEEERYFSPEEEYYSEKVVEHHTALQKPVVGKDIPIHRDKDWNTAFREKLSSEYRQEHLPLVQVESSQMEVATRSEEEDDDDETVILETYELEEKEQRIAMAIFEEVEFSSKRTEGGKQVSLGGIDGLSEIPAFWEPDKFEGVVDKRKKKVVQVKETDQKGGDTRSRHLTNILALEDGRQPSSYRENQQIKGPKPMSVQEERHFNSSSMKPDIDKEMYENITELDKVLEEELEKDHNEMEAAETANTYFERVEKTREDGDSSVTPTRSSYEKRVHLDRKSPSRFREDVRDSKVHMSYSKPAHPERGRATNRREDVRDTKVHTSYTELATPGRGSPTRFQETISESKANTSHTEPVDLDRSSPDIFATIPRNTRVPVYSSRDTEKASTRAIETTLNPYTRRTNHYGPDMDYIGSSILKGREHPEIPDRSPDRSRLRRERTKSPDISDRISRGRKSYRSAKPKAEQKVMDWAGYKSSHTEPNNVSFRESSVRNKQSYASKQEPSFSAPPPFEVPSPVDALPGPVVHSEQSEPMRATHYEKDADGNTVKVTEWQHKLTKTVEYPEEAVNQTSVKQLPEAGYIHMNLHEGIVTSDRTSEDGTETTEEHVMQNNYHDTMSTRNHTDVTEETEVGLKPYHFESRETSMKVNDEEDFPKEKQFLYDMKRSQLKPIPRPSRSGWGRKQTYGTMSTHL